MPLSLSKIENHCRFQPRQRNSNCPVDNFMSSHVRYSIKRPRKACFCAIMLTSHSGHCALNSVRRRDGLTDRSLSRLPLILSTFPTHQNFSPQNFSANLFPGKTSFPFLRNILGIKRNNTQQLNCILVNCTRTETPLSANYMIFRVQITSVQFYSSVLLLQLHN